MRTHAAKFLALFVLVLAAGPAGAAQPPCPTPDGTYCPFGGVATGDWHCWKDGTRYIPVYLHRDYLDTLAHPPSGTSLNETQVRSLIAPQLQEIQQFTNANVRLELATAVLTGSQTPPPGSIVIVPDDCPPNASACAHPNYDASKHIVGCQIEFQPGNGPYGDGTFLQETLHCLGLAHPFDCGLAGDLPSQFSIMNYSPFFTSTWRPYEIHGLEHIWGMRAQSHNAATSQGSTGDALGSNWSVPFDTVPGANDTRGNFAACGNGVYRSQRFGHTRNDGSVGWWDENFQGSPVTETLVFPAATTLYPPGIACDGTGGYAAAALVPSRLEELQTFRLKRYFFLSQQQDLTIAGTASGDAVSLTYDPASGKYVYVSRNDQSAYVEVRVGTNPATTEFGTGVMGVPDIECASPTLVGTENCMVAWLDRDDALATIRWAIGHVQGTSFVVSTVPGNGGDSVDTGIVAINGPALAVRPTATTSPWLMMVNRSLTVHSLYTKAPGTAAFTFRSTYTMPQYFVAAGLALSSACTDSSCVTRFVKLLVQGWIPNF